MKFMEALSEMEAGKVVMLESHPFSLGYFIIMPGSQYIYKVVNAYLQPQVSLAMITRDDFHAEDWKVVTDAELVEALKPKPVEEQTVSLSEEKAA